MASILWSWVVATSLVPTLREHEGYYQQGFRAAKKKEYDKALVLFNKAIQRDPKDAAAYSARAGVFVEKKQYDKALADANEAIRMQPNNAWA